ncbi:hypothetical protein K788_0008079 [Paraburkholderia caribensis MBA4]|uniref:Uncharacterized protein n=1 Tax=Paraburkholderia caribensis MBA4 TaxID=1323664 RepID=A0A0P0R899_9BURK|nr:hypothetical protein K788_0008079 [Paraburkholderia caribensis MBA4]
MNEDDGARRADDAGPLVQNRILPQARQPQAKSRRNRAEPWAAGGVQGGRPLHRAASGQRAAAYPVNGAAAPMCSNSARSPCAQAGRVSAFFNNGQ